MNRNINLRLGVCSEAKIGIRINLKIIWKWAGLDKLKTVMSVVLQCFYH